MLPSASRGMTSGSSSSRDVPVISASKAGSRSRSRARASRSAAVRLPRRAGETAPTWLARMARRPEWKAPPSDSRGLRVPVPAQVEDRSLRREQVQRALQPGRGGAGVDDEVTTVGGVGGQGEVDAERRGDDGAGAVDVDQRDRDAGVPGQQPRDAAADHAGADHGDPVADQRGGVPERVDRGLDGAGQHGTRRRYALGHDDDSGGRHHVRALVRVKAEHGAAAQLRRAAARPRRR